MGVAKPGRSGKSHPGRLEPFCMTTEVRFPVSLVFHAPLSPSVAPAVPSASRRAPLRIGTSKGVRAAESHPAHPKGTRRGPHPRLGSQPEIRLGAH